VPPEALMLTSDNKVLFLDESKAKVQERAHEDDYFWTIMTEKGWARTPTGLTVWSRILTWAR